MQPKSCLRPTASFPRLSVIRYKEKRLHDGFLEFNCFEGRMEDNHHCRKGKGNQPSYVNAEHHRDGYVVGYESANMEILDEDWADGLATPAFYSASVRSPETSSETSYHSGNACIAPSIDQGLKHTHSIRELISQHQASLANSQQKRKELNADSRYCQMEAQGSMDRCQHGIVGRHELPARGSQISIEDPDCNLTSFEADIDVARILLKFDGQPQTGSESSKCEKKLSFPRTSSWHLTQRKHGEGFSFQTPLLWKGTLKKGIASFQGSSVDQSAFAKMTFNQRKGAPAKDFLERHPLSLPMFGRSFPSIHSHNDMFKAKKSSLVGFGSTDHAHNEMMGFTKTKAYSLSSLPLSEIKYVEKADEFTPLSPLSLSDASYCERHDKYNGKQYVDIAWLATSKTHSPLHTPSKANWVWRGKSLDAKASLRSAARNLEAAFVGSRSVSLPKTRSQTHQKDTKSERSRLIDRVFVSPMKGRHKHPEISTPIERPQHSGNHFVQDSMRSRLPLSREADADASCRSMAGCAAPAKPINRPLPFKSQQKHESSDLESSWKPLLPASRSVHCLAPSKEASGQGKPSFSRTQKLPDLPTSRPNGATPYMLQCYLQCIVRDGVPCYALTINNSEEMLLAKACAFENYSSKEGCKWMYTFHSGRGKSRGKGASGWRNWNKKDSKTFTDLAGKMQVSTLLCSEGSPTGEITHSLVSEFVLFDGKAEDPVCSESLRFLSSGNECQNSPTLRESPLSAQDASAFVLPSRKHMEDIPRGPTSARMSSKNATTTLTQSYSPMKGTAGHQPGFSFDVWSDSDLTDPDVKHLSSCPSHLELAAIVIQIPTEDHEVGNHHPKNGACAWGLKFDDSGKPEDSCSVHQTPASGRKLPQSGFKSHSHMHQQSTHGEMASEDKNCCHLNPNGKSSSAQKAKLQQGVLKNSEHVTIMLPKEHHGVPNVGVSGPIPQRATIMLPIKHHSLPNGGECRPSSLIERWKCGGKCDCGGWDLGCGMKVFSTERSKKSATCDSNTIRSLSHNQPLNIYSQGKRPEVVLSLSLVHEGFFMLNFQGELSPLEAFATSVAILHSRESLSSQGKRIKKDLLKNTLPQRQWETRERSDSGSKGIDVPAFLEVYRDIPVSCPPKSIRSQH